MTRTKNRPYRKRKRALSEEETRRRITEAAVELHGTLGPASTTVTELARLAGVSRMTVYNHFPTDADIFQACSSHWAAQNPFPDPTAWAEVGDPSERLRRGLTDLYSWYGRTEGMMDNILRDEAVVPAVAHVMDMIWRPYLDAVREALAAAWPAGERDGPALHAMLALMIDFDTWQALSAACGTREDPASLATDMVVGALALRAG